MAAELAHIAQVHDQRKQIEQYKEALQAVLGSNAVAQLKAFVDHMLSDSVPLVISRQLLQAFATDMTSLPAETQKEVAAYALERLQPRVVSYEEAVSMVREHLAALLEQEEQWAKAAQTLAGIDLDSGQRVLDNEYKLAKYVKIAMLYLEDDDAVSAETFIKKASALMGANCNQELELQYKASYARILDAKRKFLEAAQRYYEFSQLDPRVTSQIGEEQLVDALTAAVTCTILAAAGPQRSRLLANLYKDERCTHLPVFPFLEKVYLERILRKEQVDAFAEGLKEHQRALLPDGSTVLERAVVEHNLAAASRLYTNIYFEQLGPLLGVPADQAEQIAARMIAEERLKGCIDQVEGLIRFDTKSEQLQAWDEQIASVCNSLNSIIDNMAAKGIRLEA